MHRCIAAFDVLRLQRSGRSRNHVLVRTAEMREDQVRQLAQQRLSAPEVTPMMRQYLSVKLDFPQALVLFRMGDFYETFFEDAEECAERLSITLTSRSKEQDIKMAGVPHHALDGHLRRLIDQGCTVVLVDQVEDPKQAKGLVQREVTRVVTPGTYIDSDGDRTHHLVSVEFRRDKKKRLDWGLAALDFGTGDFRATSGVEEASLLDELERLNCKELLLLSSHSEEVELHARLSNVLVTWLEVDNFASDISEAAIERVLGAAEAKQCRGFHSSDAWLAAGRLLLHLERTQLRAGAPDLVSTPSLEHITTIRPYTASWALMVDADARRHLELFQSQSGQAKGSLWSVLNKTRTSMGKRLLREWMSFPPRDLNEVSARHRAVHLLLQHRTRLDEVREGLKQVTDVAKVATKVALGRVTPKDLSSLRNALRVVPSVLGALKEIPRDGLSLGESEPSRLEALSETDPLSDVLSMLERSLLEEPALDPSQGNIFREGFDEEIDRSTKLAQDGQAMVASLEVREREATKIHSLKVRNNRVFGYFIEVTKANVHLVPDTYIRKQTMVNAERYITDELKELEEDLLHAEEHRVEASRAQLKKLIASLGVHLARVQTLSQALAQVDVLCCLAERAARLDWVCPEMGGDAIEIEEGRHPVLESLSSQLGQRFIPNDVRLDASRRLHIITGPNMAGKSTIMRQTALIVILAYLGSWVPARRAKIGEVKRIFTRVGASDDLSKGHSTFMVEMMETARILREAEKDDLILIDEIGRGTSTFDGLSIAWAVAEFIHDEVRAKTLFATHYHELTGLPGTKRCAKNYHIQVREFRDEIVFLRRLMEGPTNRSYGVQVARLAGLPKAVVSRASALLGHFEERASEIRALVAADGGDSEGASQLSLFAPGTRGSRPAARGTSLMLEAIKARVLARPADDMTPRDALDLVSELQTVLTEEASLSSEPDLG